MSKSKTPKKAKGIVKREVICVITPECILDEENPTAGENNYLACLCAEKDLMGLTFLDISTGEFQVSGFSDRDSFLLAIAGLDFKELILARSFPDKILTETLEMQIPAGWINYLKDDRFLAKGSIRVNCLIVSFHYSYYKLFCLNVKKGGEKRFPFQEQGKT